jgi:lysophosphatidylcholine acyltransferase/lyso-PAF acetyltransferase
MTIYKRDIVAFLVAEYILYNIVPSYFTILFVIMQCIMACYMYHILKSYTTHTNDRGLITELQQKLRDNLEQNLELKDIGNKLAALHPAHYLQNNFDRLRISVMTVTLVILRIIAILIIYVVIWMVVRIATFKYDFAKYKDIPVKNKWRRFVVDTFIPILIRLLVLVAGYFKIDFIENQYDTVGSTTEDINDDYQLNYMNLPTPIHICNHVSFIDPFIISCKKLFCAVGASNQVNYPLLHDITTRLQYIIVDRQNHDSKLLTANTINKRATESLDHITNYKLWQESYEKGVNLPSSLQLDYNKFKAWKPILMFPEGTTTNGECVINFRNGAFNSLMPIQPYVINYPSKYPNNRFHPCWTQDQQPLWLILIRMLCEPINYATLNKLRAQIARTNDDAVTYRDRVRKLMAQNLGVPMADVDAYTLLKYNK